MVRMLYTTNIPPLETLIARLDEQTLSAWCARHGELLDKKGICESLSALCLLRSGHPKGTLAYTEKGRPYFVEGGSSFSLSHTEGGVLCALLEHGERREIRLGLDAEGRGRRTPEKYDALAARWFSERERALYEGAEDRELAFLRIWTGKEALVKATGGALSSIGAADTAAAAEMGFTLFRYDLEDLVVTLALPSEIAETSVQWEKISL